VRSSTLKLVCKLEVVSPTSIIEKYQFDVLISRRLKATPSETRMDEDKSAAFKAIILLLRLRS
jgi:hypothetical protein